MNDEELKARLQQAQGVADGGAPDFAAAFAAAEHQVRRRRRNRFTGLAAAAVLAIAALGLLAKQQDEYRYIDVDELVATTRWLAPSDSLLPQHQLDIYRDVPRLFDATATSTNTEEGTLL